MTKIISFSFIQKRLAVGVMVIAMLFGMCAMTPVVAHAQTTENTARLETMMAQIQQLMQIVAQLQARVVAMHANQPTSSTVGRVSTGAFYVGDRVQTTDNLKTRIKPGPDGDVVRIQPAYQQGEVIAGPRVGVNGYRWWQVSYDNGVTGWSAQNWLRKVVAVTVPPILEPEEDTTEEDEAEVEEEVTEDDNAYAIEITSPSTGKTYEPGDRVTIKWTQENLDGEKGVVTLEGNNTERHIAENVDIGAGYLRVNIPESDSLGVVTSGTYELQLWVSYLKDGDPKGKSDTVRIVIENILQDEMDRLMELIEELEESDTPTEDDLQNEINELIEKINDLNSANEAPDETTEDDLQNEINELIEKINALNNSTDTVDDSSDSTDIPSSHAIYDTDIQGSDYQGSYVIKVNGATVDSDAARSYTRDEVMDICEDIVRDNLNAEISCLYMDERIYDTTEITSGGQPSVDLLSTNAKLTEAVSNPEQNVGEFEIRFEVTAVGEDVLVPGEAIMVGDQSDRRASIVAGPQEMAWLYQIEGELSGILEPDEGGNMVSAVIVSDAEEIETAGNKFYRIDEGDTEEFTLLVAIDPSKTDEYRLNLANFTRYYFVNGSNFYYMIFFIDTSDFRTSREFVPNEVVPEANYFACDRNSDGQYSNGDVACYGVWDYGNSFGGDEDMCEDDEYDAITGCVVAAPVCESGSAEATAYYSNRQLEDMSSSRITTIANNLDTSNEMVQSEMAGLWEYSCVPAGTVQGASTSGWKMQLNQLLEDLKTLVSKI